MEPGYLHLDPEKTTNPEYTQFSILRVSVRPWIVNLHVKRWGLSRQAPPQVSAERWRALLYLVSAAHLLETGGFVHLAELYVSGDFPSLFLCARIILSC
jgi:hypothetical protein